MGSYSMAITFAGMPCLLRLKSISRSICFSPPPWWRTEILPCAFLPPVFLTTPLNKYFSGFPLVMMPLVSTSRRCLTPGLVGTLVRIVIDLGLFLNDVYFLTFFDGHKCFFSGGFFDEAAHFSGPAFFSGNLDRLYREHIDRKGFLDRFPDLPFRGGPLHFKAVAIGGGLRHGFFRYERPL